MANNLLADAILAPEGRGVRSRDLKGKKFEWTDLKLVHEFGDDSPYKGRAVAYVDHPDDLAALGKTMGHCAGTHFIWACEEKTWAFFTIVTTDDMQPHVTLHAKWLKWYGKIHPRDQAPSPYVPNSGRVTCGDCLGHGGRIVKGSNIGAPGYWGDSDVARCKICDGRGTVAPPKPEAGEVLVPYPRASSGGYCTYADVVAAFESVGRKYEAGKWAPVSFKSRTYDIPPGYKEPLANFDGTYGQYVIGSRPNGVTEATWDTYAKTLQAMKAEYDKNSGAVQVVGRTFKFDKKEWYVVSFSDRGQGRDPNTAYRGMMHEFFIECSKKKPKESDGK